MMNKKHILVSLAALICGNATLARIPSVIEHRSQSSNTARKVAGEFGYVHLRDQEDWYARYASTFEYQRSFNSRQLARSLFGCYVNECDQLIIQGSDVIGRDENALLADYFYLPTDFDATVTVKPVISDLIFDFNAYIGFNAACLENCYLRVYAPLVRSKWSLNMKECFSNTGTLNHPAGYFTPCEMQSADLLHSFCDYLSGDAPAPVCATVMNNGLNQEPDDLDVGDELAKTVFNGLNYYRGSCCESRTATTLADLRAELGWNFLNKEHGHLGVNLQAAFPTGTRPNAAFMFNPVVGNGKHWELGGGVTSHVIFWECGDLEKSFGVNLDANFTYMFDNHEQRTFDLRTTCSGLNQELSRFMLAQRLGAQVAPVGAIAGSIDDGESFTTPCGQFKYEYTPVANLTTLDIKVRASIQFDMALWFNYTNRNFSVDLGYNLWLRSCDRIQVPNSCGECPSLCDPINRDVWVLKGTSQVYGFVDRQLAEGACDENFAIPLSPSESRASITNGAQPQLLGESPLDNPQLAWGNLEGDELNRERLFTTPQGGTQVETSISPIYINCNNIDFCTRNEGLTNKIWTNLQWTWDLDRDCNPLRCRPFLGVGAEVEFAKTSNDCNPCSVTSVSSCLPCNAQPEECKVPNRFCCCEDDCIRVAASQWGLWLKGGMNFE